MKLHWYDRILVALSGLVLMALGVCVILAGAGVIELPPAIAFDTWLGDGWQWMPLIFIAGALLVIWGLWLLIRPWRHGEPGGKYYTLQSEDNGEVRISVHAIDNLVRKCIDKYEQIVSTKVRIGGKEDAMQITLHMTIRSDVQIPELIETVRQDIIRSLQRSAGVKVETVQVYVDATKDDPKAKDEDIPYIQAAARPSREEPEVDAINTVSFYTTPVVVTEDAKPDESPILKNEPTIAELKKQIDFGPDEPLPVDLSEQAFPFPEKEAGVPLEIFTDDVPIADKGEEDS